MNQINATINLDSKRLNVPRVPIHPRLGHSFAVELVNAPDDVLDVFVRIFRPDGSYFDFPANERPNGVWLVYIIGTAFTTVGSSVYEIHATDARGNPTALGFGTVFVEPFSVTTTPIQPGAVITVAQIPTADGAMVQIRMVQDEVGQWVYEALVPGGES